ncbi:MAG: NAD(P)H-hydrate dehydratase [Candidatus Omnitrophota bacterium]
MKILCSHWMQALDAEAIHRIGIPSIVLMENASRGAADFFAAQFPLPVYQHVIVVAGKGNNGGDGLATGRILYQKGYRVECILLSNPDHLNPDPKINLDILKNLNLPLTVVSDQTQVSRIQDIFRAYHSADTFVIDALFGTGLNQPIQNGLYSDAIRLINESHFNVASIDIPSGLSDRFLPEEGIHVTADATATFQCLKTTHIYPDGNKFCGTIRIIDIGIPWPLVENDTYYIRVIEPSSITECFKKRAIDAHKGTYGHSLTLCGSFDKPGAGILSSFAVLKSGAGLCTAAVSADNRTLPVLLHPELMILVYHEPDELLARLNEFNAILIGPGLGSTDRTTDLVSLMMEKSNVPLVLDADALNAIHSRKDLLKQKRHYPIVITPHPGEFSRLTGKTIGEIRKDRLGIGRSFAMDYHVYLILKGHHTLVITPDGNVYVNPTGNPGMATAGSGDVLSGIITGMISQFISVYPIETILQAAVFIHGYAGDRAVEAVGEISLTATDILRFIPNAILTLDDYRTPFPITR